MTSTLSRRRKVRLAGAVSAMAVLGLAVGAGFISHAQAAEAAAPARQSALIVIDTPMPAPAWALAERALLQANAKAVEAFEKKYVAENGYLRGPEHYGITDGPDDAVEPIRNWPLAHMLGGPESILRAWSRVWEAHLDQYTRAKVPEVPVAAEGIYYREFMPQFDWEHISEGMAGFYFYGLSEPDDPQYAIRLRRYAGFYNGEDPTAPNYDREHKIIRSLLNGSRGPRLTPVSPTDWDGPEVPGGAPGRRTRFLKASNVRGDHPLNLASTNMALHAYMVTGDEKYRAWLLEYVGAWRDRTAANGGNIPSNIGLDGKIGGEWDGKWYGGVFGWNSPDEGVRNYVFRGPPEGFGNALLATGDLSYAGVLRRQLDNMYAQKKVENGKTLIPHYYGDQGWYGFQDVNGRSPGLGNRRRVETDLYLWTLDPKDLARLPKTGWIGYLQGADPDYPLKALQAGLEDVREGGQRIRDDESDYHVPVGVTRWERSNPVATEALINLTLGGPDPGGSGHGPLPLHTVLRHFDPIKRRAGLPDDVAVLVQMISPGAVVLTVVNTSPLEARTVTIQTGAYAEHQATSVTIGGNTTAVDASAFDVKLAPGAGQTLTIGMRRYANRPTLAFPWDRDRSGRR